MKKSIELFDLFIYSIMILISLSILYPLLNLLAISFSGSVPILQGTVGIFPKEFNLASYKQILQSNQIPRAYGNMILYTTVGFTINMIMTAITAYPLSQHILFGRSFFLRMITITLFLSGGTIPNLLLVKELNLYNSLWSLALPNAIWTIELFILVSFYRSLPESLYESMRIDGASHFTLLWKLVLPLSKASLASIALFYFMGHWNSFFLPLIYLQDRAKYPLQIVLKDMLLEGSETTSTLIETAKLTPAGVKNAVIVVTMVPVLMIYPLAQRYFVQGVMIGSVKG